MKKILIVEDEMNLAVLMGLRLDTLGYKVIGAANGAEAVKKAKRERPDLIILDLMIPVFDGYEVCRILKEDEATKRIPVVVVTAKTSIADMDEAFRCGVDDYITKPYEWQKLYDKIKKYLV